MSRISNSLKTNPIQFAVVREDPEVEIALFRKYKLSLPIFIGSGGCTALALASQYPQIPLTLIEPNPAQVELIKEKVTDMLKLKGESLQRRFGVGANAGDDSLIEKGNFEALFRGLRTFIFEFIADRGEISRLLLTGTVQEWKMIFAHPYWPVAFDLFLSESLLKTMFGQAAIQHAPKDSYSRYFRLVFEKGLLRQDRGRNYFLFHLLLGHYPEQESSWPIFLQKPPSALKIDYLQMLAQDVQDYSPFDFVGLSNIFDWSSKAEIKYLARKIGRQLKTGAFVVYRQLNNENDFRSFFGSDFKWLDSEATNLHRKDRSLFYSSLHIARKTK